MLTAFFNALSAQHSCWVLLTDKDNTDFDPYSYFDGKAIERYRQCGADIYDVSNYPLNGDYVAAVSEFADEVVGCSRWLNAIGIIISKQNLQIVKQLPFVKDVVMINEAVHVECAVGSDDDDRIIETLVSRSPVSRVPQSRDNKLKEQIIRFGGALFHSNGIDGAGLRIAVLDGGFPAVDTHPAFQHLRDDNRIVATYNFPNKREYVYGWNSHGTMVLSCIAGVYEGQKLGLATGAEFLLARTEIAAEPFKEEIWWQMGMEWADKNGADIINSSLGYGKQRYYTKDMDGTSYVARAANMAAAKGILVCCSAGNEGDDKRWRTIVTPSDADSVICVGGIEASDEYRHIYFSSYGPTADGRQKPDVVAYGEATVAKPSGGLTIAAGTSFSSPLTAGFCACAWQTHRELNAMQMKEEIIKSCDLYPYHDYAFGHGVPQADYFLNEYAARQRTFFLTNDNDSVQIHLLKDLRSYGIDAVAGNEVFVSIGDGSGHLGGYHQVMFNDSVVSIDPAQLGEGNTVTVSYGRFCDSIKITGNTATPDQKLTAKNADVGLSRNTTYYDPNNEKTHHSLFVSADGFLKNATWDKSCSHFGFGYRFMYGGKHYNIGAGISGDLTNYRSDMLQRPDSTQAETLKDVRSDLRTFYTRLLFTQRLIIIPDALFIDIEAYGGVALGRTSSLTKKYDYSTLTDPADGTTDTKHTVKEVLRKTKSINPFQYGVTARLGYSVMGMLNISLYGSYRISDVVKKSDFLLGEISVQPSPWSIGAELEFCF